jgi:hypothetical protein
MFYRVTHKGHNHALAHWSHHAMCDISSDRVHLCREEEELVDVCRELGLTHVVEVSDKGKQLVGSVVSDVFVLGDGGVRQLLEGSEPASIAEQHSAELEAWWEAALEHLLPAETTACKQEGEAAAQQDAEHEGEQ